MPQRVRMTPVRPRRPRVGLPNLAEWRRQLSEEGDGEPLDPTLTQEIAPRLMAELEHVWAVSDAARLDHHRDLRQARLQRSA